MHIETGIEQGESQNTKRKIDRTLNESGVSSLHRLVDGGAGNGGRRQLKSKA